MGPVPPSTSLPRAAGLGVLATLAGLAGGHLAAALVDPATSPVVAVGATVIDLTPTPVKEWAVATFGTADKPILLTGVLLVSLALSAVAGVLARRRLAPGAALLVGLVALAGLAALARPAAGVVDALPALVSGAVAVATLAWTTGRLTSYADGQGAAGHRLSRRSVLLTGAATVALAGVGHWITTLKTRVADVVLPQADDPAGPFPRGLQVDGITPLRTPVDDFYRVDTKLAVPTVDAGSWTLTIDGDVERELTLTFDQLRALPLVERDITMTCVSNDVGGRYVGSARWLGVRLTDLLDRVGVGGRADQILSTDVEGFTISTPLAVATDGRDAMVAIGMNGEALPREHGFPARLVTPGIYGYVGSTKWLSRLTLTTYAEQVAYWTERDWATDAPVKIASRIDTPRPLARVSAGPVVVAGVAWAQTRGIAAVEVQVDDGPWTPAELGPAVSVDYWRQWHWTWDALPGSHELAVRATGGDGEVQTARRAAPFPAGSSGIQRIVVTVE